MAENNENRIEIEIVLDDGTLKKGFLAAEVLAGKSGNKIGRSLSGNIFSGIGKALTGVQAQILAVGATFVAAFAGRRVIEAAARQQDAINSLNTSLKLAGSFSVEASNSFQQWASSLQAATKVGDEAILELAALSRNFARSNEEAQKLTEAALELSAATGISLEGAVKNLGKTFAGLTGELGESVPALRNLTAEELKAGKALDFVLDRFGGAAASQVNTFSGAFEQLKNTFGDLLEEIGNLVIKSPVVIKLFQEIAKNLGAFATSLKDAGSGDPFGSLVIGVVSVTRVINTFLTPALIGVTKLSAKFVESFAIGLGFIITLIQQVSFAFIDDFIIPVNNGLASLARAVGADGIAKSLEKDINRSLSFQNALDGVAIKLTELGALTQTESFQNLVNLGDPTEQVDKFLTDLQAKLEEAQGQAIETGAILGNNLGTGIALGIQQDATFFQFLGNVFGEVKNQINETSNAAQIAAKTSAEAYATLAKNITENNAKVAKSLKTTFVSGASNALAAFGQAIGKGENALVALGRGVLNVFGDILIQLGNQTLAVGLAMSAVPVLFGLQGGAAIAAGAAFIVAGGILKGLAGAGGGGGGGASASAPAASATAGGVGSIEDSSGLAEGITDLQPLEGREVGSSVVVNIQGDVLDGDETGLRIADILREQGFQNGVTVGV